MDAENGRSAARQPRGPLTRCLPEVPPASDHLRRRAPAAPPPRKPTSSEHQREGALGLQKTGVPAGAEPANPGAPSPGVYPRCPPPQLASAGALPRSAASDALPPDHCPLGVGPVTTRVHVSKFLKLAIFPGGCHWLLGRGASAGCWAARAGWLAKQLEQPSSPASSKDTPSASQTPRSQHRRPH